MMKIRYLYLLLLIFAAGCSSSKHGEYTEDFNVKYSVSNSLMGTSAKIEITQGSLNLFYSNSQKHTNLNENYTLEYSDVSSLYKYMKSISFMSMKSPAPGVTLDASSVLISAVYSGKTNEISIGNAKDPSQDIVKLKNMILGMVSKYGSDTWKKSAIY